MKTYQQHEESLNDYAKRSKYNGDIVKNLIGDSILHTYIKTTDAYSNANSKDRKEMLDESFECLSTYILLRGADSAKYGTLMKNFVSQYSLGNNQYPTKRSAGIDALSKHTFDEKYNERKKRMAEKNKYKGKRKDDESQLEQQLSLIHI